MLGLQNQHLRCVHDILGRGYVVMKEDPIVEHIPIKTLTRTDLKYVIMIRNRDSLPTRKIAP